ncbi:MAG: branched-chain amino acid transaminase [Methanobacteriota archaeon]|nr:MAG: branched-chain amino acid transaminase [Euryarchaeota archaeon]
MQIEPPDKVWKNGGLIAWKDANVHALSHGLHYGTAVFEGIRCYETRNGLAVFRLKDHMTRLHLSAKAINMAIPHSVDELCSATKEVISANGLASCYIRPISLFGASGIGVNPIGYPVDTFIMAFPLGAYLGEDGIKNGIRVHTSSWRRTSGSSVPATAKICGSYVNSALAVMEAKQNGFDEALLLNEHGMVAEGSGENLFVVIDDEILTPPLSTGILSGITRNSVMKIASSLEHRVTERDISRGELYLADELFFTGSAAEITPIRELDRRTVGTGKPGPVTKILQARFRDIVAGENSEWADWLDPVR